MSKAGAPPKIMVLASGKAGTLEAIVRTMQADKKRGRPLEFEVGLVVSNHPEETFPTIKRLNNEFGLAIGMETVNEKLYPHGKAERGMTDEESQKIHDYFEDGRFAAIACLGYMKILRGILLDDYGWKPGMDPFEARIINTHPGKVPETAGTYGIGAAQKILDLGLAATAHTLHVVSAGVDEGPVIRQTLVPVKPGDTADELFHRVLKIERAALPKAISFFVKSLKHQSGQPKHPTK
jgi:folate-dependent phosphoribosylglycinamide formyltransferase PurN